MLKATYRKKELFGAYGYRKMSPLSSQGASVVASRYGGLRIHLKLPAGSRECELGMACGF